RDCCHVKNDGSTLEPSCVLLADGDSSFSGLGPPHAPVAVKANRTASMRRIGAPTATVPHPNRYLRRFGVGSHPMLPDQNDCSRWILPYSPFSLMRADRPAWHQGWLSSSIRSCGGTLVVN